MEHNLDLSNAIRKESFINSIQTPSPDSVKNDLRNLADKVEHVNIYQKPIHSHDPEEKGKLNDSHHVIKNPSLPVTKNVSQMMKQQLLSNSIEDVEDDYILYDDDVLLNKDEDYGEMLGKSNSILNTEINDDEDSYSEDQNDIHTNALPPVDTNLPLAEANFPIAEAQIPNISQGLIDEVNAIKPDTDKAPQQILKDILQKLKEQSPPNTPISIISSLKKDDAGNYLPAAYTHPDKPETIFYKTQVTFKFKVGGQDVELPEITLDAFTTAVDPDVALMAALKYAETASQLALKAEDQQDTRIENFENDAAKDRAMNAPSFQFKFFSSNGGKSSTIASITASGVKIKLNPNPEQSKPYLYDYTTKKLLPDNVESRRSLRDHALMHFNDEAEAILHVGHLVKDDKIFDRLVKQVNTSRNMQDIAEGLKKDIEKTEAELAQYKAVLYQEPLMRLFGAEGRNKKEFEQYLAGLESNETARNKAFEEGKLLPSMMEYISQKNKLKADKEKYRIREEERIEGGIQRQIERLQFLKENPREQNPADRDLMAEIAHTHGMMDHVTDYDRLIEKMEEEKIKLQQLEANVEALSQSVTEEQSTFRRTIDHVRVLNQELDRKVYDLKQALEQAKAKLHQAPDAPPISIFLDRQANDFISTIESRVRTKTKVHDKIFGSYMEQLESKVERNKKFMAGVLVRLGQVGANSGAEVVAVGGGNHPPDIQLPPFNLPNDNPNNE